MLRRPSRGPEVSLRSLALFSRCSDRELRRVARIATEVEVEAGRLLTCVGRPNDQFFVVVSGIASVWRGGVRLGVLQRG
jgi:CRP-like cAMP-binding protein